VVAGALSVADGLRVIAIRSQLMSQLAGQGAVGLLKLDAQATEALIADLRANAPHIKCSVVMAGHVGTPILVNSHKIQNSSDGEALNDIAQMRQHLALLGSDVSTMSDEAIRKAAIDRARRYLEDAPTTAQQAATIILDGVKADRWRILVGKDAERLDELMNLGVDAFILAGVPHLEEARRVGRQVLPLLKGRIS